VSAAITAALVVALCAAQEGGTPSSPAPAVAPPAPLVAATFYAWYDHPGAHFVDSAGRDLLRDHFVDPELVHADSPDWFAGELADAADAGLDVLLCASVDAATAWPAALGTALERTRGRLARPIRAALLVEPWCLAAKRDGGFDLDDAPTRAATLAAILDFQRALRPEDWAQLDGAPLVAFGRVSGGGDGGKNGPAPAAFFAELRARFREEFGRAMSLLVDRSWNREGQPSQGDRTWREGAAILGPQLGTVASLAPGYDDRQLEKPLGIFRPRENGAVYQWAWQQLMDGPHELVVVESWNQFHDGTAIAPSLEHGRLYVEVTRTWADLLRAGRSDRKVAPPRFDGPVGGADFAEQRHLSTRDDVFFRPGDEGGGIALTTECDARLAFPKTKGEFILEASARGVGRDAVLRFDVGDAFPFATPEPLEMFVRYTATGGATKVELAGRRFQDGGASAAGATEFVSFGDDAAGAGETRIARFAVDGLRMRGHAAGVRTDFELRIHGGPIALREIALRRTRHRIRSVSGVQEPFRRVSLDWKALEPQAGAIDAARLRAALGVAGDGAAIGAEDENARACGVVVLQRPPEWAVPIGAHPDDVAATVRRVVAAMAEDPSLRFLELLPRANRDGVVGKVADVQGYVGVLRAASKAAHEVAPNVALVLGAVDGPDVPWLRTIQGLKQPFAYDAATFEWNDESGTPGDATCAREFQRMLSQWWSGGDGEKPFFVVRGAWVGRPTAEDAKTTTSAVALLPTLLHDAWQRLAMPPSRIAVLDEEALPLVHGAPAAKVVAALAAAGLEGVARTTPDLASALETGEVSTVVLAEGEWLPEALAPLLVPFVDRGGLLVCLGGAPFRRTAERTPDGGFTLRDESPLGGELRDDLRIEVAPVAGGGRLDVMPTGDAAELAPLRGAKLDGAATFMRRAGRPRKLQGIHRFEPLLEGERDGERVGAIAALVTYSSDRNGALLLIGADGGGRTFDESRATAIEASLHALARERGALASFVLPADDAH
jgi:hypothetical protein